MTSSALATSAVGSAATIREERTGYIGSRLLLQHFSTLWRREQPRFWHLLNHLTGLAANHYRCPAVSECSRVSGAFLLRSGKTFFFFFFWPRRWAKGKLGNLCKCPTRPHFLLRASVFTVYLPTSPPPPHWAFKYHRHLLVLFTQQGDTHVRDVIRRDTLASCDRCVKHAARRRETGQLLVPTW